MRSLLSPASCKFRAATVLLLISAPAAAQPAGVPACAACHGTRGEGGSTGAPALAGQSREYLTRQLEAYADGRRRHAVMTPIAQRLDPREREAIAAYYAGLRAPLPPPPAGEVDIRVKKA